MIRSIFAIIAGYLSMFLFVSIFFAIALFVGVGGMPADPGAFRPPAWLTVLELVFSPVGAIVGGYVCAWVARQRPMRHAAILIGVMVPLGVLSIAFDQGLKPLWSSLAVVVLGVAGTWLGARLRIAHVRA